MTAYEVVIERANLVTHYSRIHRFTRTSIHGKNLVFAFFRKFGTVYTKNSPQAVVVFTLASEELAVEARDEIDLGFMSDQHPFDVVKEVLETYLLKF